LSDAEILERLHANPPGSGVVKDLFLELIRRGSPGTVDAMHAYLTSPDHGDAARAVMVLQAVGNPSAVAELEASLATAPPLAIAFAARALARLNAQEALPALIRCLENRGEELGSSALAVTWAIEQMPHASAVPALAGALRMQHAGTRKVAARALYKIRAPESLAALQAAADEQSFWTGRHARKALRLKKKQHDWLTADHRGGAR
jgi:HEAT repeat protein